MGKRYCKAEYWAWKSFT